MSLATVLKRSKTERESWRYTDLEKLLKNPPPPERQRLAIKPGKTQGPSLVFIDGVLSQRQSRFDDLPQSLLTGDAENGYRLSVEKETCLVTQPIELIFQGTSSATETSVKLHVELGRSARLTLIERHEGGLGAQVMHTQIVLDEQAKCVHGKIIKGAAHLATSKVSVAEGAYYDNFALIKDAQLARNEIEASLAGKRAQCHLNGAMLLRGQEHADVASLIAHEAPHGVSRQIYKSVVAGRAHGVFQGKILVKQDAQKTDGKQLSRALLLSDQAEMNAKPELEIYADDVKCSHGCTVGQLDDDALFYLRARGLDEREARRLLIDAFVGEALDEIHADDLRDLCRAEMEEWLHEHD